MSTSDPIADLLTRIRNGINAEHRYVDVPWSNMKQNIAEVLKQCGFVESFLVKQDGPKGTLRVFLKYAHNRKPVIHGIKRISKPGLRRYVGATDIPCFFGGLGVAVVSTSQGVLSGHDAVKRKVGGELLCLVW